MPQTLIQTAQRWRVWLYAVAGLVALALPVGQALALQGFGISPASQTITITPGGSESGTLTVINAGDTTVNYKIYVSDYSVKGETYLPDFSSTGLGPDISPISWYKVPTGTYTITADKQTTFPYSIHVPKGAAVGGHYATIFIQTIPASGGSGTYISRIDRIGSIFYLTAAGNLIQTGSVRPLAASWLQLSPPIQAQVRFTNTGNVHFLAMGTATLSTPFGKTGVMQVFQGEVLPSTTRLFALKLGTSSSIGLYKVTTHINYLGRNVTMSRWVVLVPLITLIVTGATVLVLLLLGVYGIMRRSRTRRRQNSN